MGVLSQLLYKLSFKALRQGNFMGKIELETVCGTLIETEVFD